MNEEKIWFEDLQNFITKDNFLKFFPTSNMSYVEQINSLVRFTVYLTIILILFRNNYKLFYVLLGVLIVTYMMYKNDKNIKEKEHEGYKKYELVKSKKTGKVCKKPTTNNPFMNRNLLALYDEKRDKEACDIQNDYVKKTVEEKFNEKLYRSADDIFMNHASDRQFYTVPNTDLVPDQTAFAKWLYERPSCKGGNNEACYENVSEVIGSQYN
jgi:hypothetical protein